MENVVFKHSIMGFNTHQVLDHIDMLLKQIKTQKQEFSTAQDKLHEQVIALNSQINQNAKESQNAKEAISLLKDEIINTNSKNEELERKLLEYKEIIAKKDENFYQVKKDLFTASAQILSLTKENEYWKERQDQISKSLVDANMKAQDIIENAYEEAQEIKIQLKEQAKQLNEGVDDIKSSILEIENQLDVSFKKVKNAINLIDSSTNDIKVKINDYAQAIDTPIKKSGYKKTNVSKDRLHNKTHHKKTVVDNLLDTLANLLNK